jgi:hypothetical protein
MSFKVDLISNKAEMREARLEGSGACAQASAEHLLPSPGPHFSVHDTTITIVNKRWLLF